MVLQNFIKTFSIKGKITRHVFRSMTTAPRVCIIGSGPAGFYTAQYVLKHHDKAEVDIFEKLPVPFGLIRYGVAPDHPEVKNASSTFEEVAESRRCSFFGNVNVGHDIKANELRQFYDAVVFAYGADDDKRLHIPGEDAKGVYAARSFVGWYNGLPAHADLQPNLNCETAVIIGQGNVALDVARLLLSPTSLLEHTDICSHALAKLETSGIKKVHIIGRRGPVEVSFTTKELREMIRLDGTKPILHKEDFVDVRPKISELPRQRKRLIELMCKTAFDPVTPNEEARRNECIREWELNFLRTPHEILTDDDNNVCGIRLEKNRLVKNKDGGYTPEGTGKWEQFSCGMVLRSVGYKSIKVEEGIPFDVRLGVIPNFDGRVVDAPNSKKILKGLYCSGWVKHGPVGVIVTTMNEAFATGQHIVTDLNEGVLGYSEEKMSSADMQTLMSKRGINYVTFEDYQNIDNEEMLRGRENKKPREKITSFNEMLKIAFRDKKSS